MTVPQKMDYPRLTTDALRYYVPYFHEGSRAERILVEHGGELSPHERSALEVRARWKGLASRSIAELCKPLTISEIQKMITTSHMRNSRHNLKDILYAAAMNGLEKGLTHFDPEKINKSATNYLFQWIITYTKKELAALEAPFGVPPSRFQKIKKVAAVRKKLSDELGRYATNEEVLEFFHSGRADRKGLVSRKDAPESGFASNANMTMQMVEEQEIIEKSFLYTELMDPLEDYLTDLRTALKSDKPFGETVFGIFVESYNLNDRARAVLKNEMGALLSMTQTEKEIADSLPKKEYQKTFNRLKEMMNDPLGPFVEFVKENRGVISNADQILSSADGSVLNYQPNYNRYVKALFEGKKVIRVV